MANYLTPPTTTKRLIRVVIERLGGTLASWFTIFRYQVFEYSARCRRTTYPYDWGFIPPRSGDDGVRGRPRHPPGSTAPGVVIKYELLALRRPSTAQRPYTLSRLNENSSHEPIGQDGVSDRLQSEIEQFFMSSVLNTGKKIKVKGWQDAAEARCSIESGMRKYKRQKQQ